MVFIIAVMSIFIVIIAIAKLNKVGKNLKELREKGILKTKIGTYTFVPNTEMTEDKDRGLQK